MTIIQTFGDFEGYSVRWNGDFDNPWWVGADVCAVLEISSPSLAINGNEKSGHKGLDDDEKGVTKINTPGGEQQVLVVNEAGLYRLIFKSRSEMAKKFQRWVFHEVLPSIRKTGKYEAPQSQSQSALPEWTPEHALRTLSMGVDILTKIGAMSDRNRIRIKAITNNLVDMAEAKLILTQSDSNPASSTTQPLSVTEYTRIYHKKTLKNNLDLSVGIAVSKAYFKIYKTRPPKGPKFMESTNHLAEVCVYEPKDWYLIDNELSKRGIIP